MKRFTYSLLLGAAFSMGLGGISFAQTSNPDTNQTDQSEEDWRKSQKKDTSDPSDPFKNILNTGIGTNLPPLREIDTLPEDSRRHLMRQRAKVIAEMEIGQDMKDADTPYTPSEAAKSDPELAAEEEAAWEVIVTDMKGTGGGGDAPDAGTGPNKVAVTGSGGSAPSSPIRGGSAQSAAEIMAKLKGMQAGGGQGGTAQSGGQGTRPMQGPLSGGSQGRQMPQGQNPQDQNTQGQGQQNQNEQSQAVKDAAAQAEQEAGGKNGHHRLRLREPCAKSTPPRPMR